MSVRKRIQRNPSGSLALTWLADYYDQHGKRHRRSFLTQRAAEIWEAEARAQVRRGIHTPDADSITVDEAAELWLHDLTIEGREPRTIKAYRGAVKTHIAPRLGFMKLARLTQPMVKRFRIELLKTHAQKSVKFVLTCLKQLLNHAQGEGLVAQNVALGVRIKRNLRDEPQVEIGKDIPSKAEVGQLLGLATGRAKALLTTAAFTGMRISELLGLTWDKVDFTKGIIHITQRLNSDRELGWPKSRKGRRDIPMGDAVHQVLREWRLACPRPAGQPKPHLVFPDDAGQPFFQNVVAYTEFYPLQAALGWGELRSTKGHKKQCGAPKYTFHTLRHFAASLFIDQGLPPMRIQELLGHGSIKMTFDIYGHLFPKPEGDRAILTRIEQEVLGKT
jgi:integrase